MKQIFFASIFMCYFLSFNAISQTYVSGSVQGVWTKENSPYIVTDDLLIDSGNSLVIEPGVVVKFNGYFEVEVRGVFRAQGTEVDSIIFTVKNSNTTWNGFYFNISDSIAVFKYCRIEYASADRNIKDAWRDYYGGAVFSEETDLRFENCLIQHNNANEYGGAIYAYDANLNFDNCLFQNNAAQESGGAANMTGSLTHIKLIIANCIFQNNNSNEYGGAINTYATTIISNSIFKENFAKYEGGAIRCSEGNYNLIYNTQFIHNSASYRGGAIYLSESHSLLRYPLLIANSYFANNNSRSGGGIYLMQTKSYIISSIFEKNTANSGYGSVLYVYADTVKVINSIISQRQISNYYNKSSIYLCTSYSSCNILNSILLNTNVDGDGFDDLSKVFEVTYSNFEGGWEGIGNIDADPQFVDVDNGDYHLKSGSPCINAGHPSAIFSDSDGTRNDMGAYGGSGRAISSFLVQFEPQGIGQQRNDFFVFLNLGEDTLTLNDAILSDETNFSLFSNFPRTILPLSMDTIFVTFHPQIPGQIEGQLEIVSDDFKGATGVQIELSGLGGVWKGNVSGVWQKANSPYILGGDITIPDGEKLTIEPGVEIFIDTTLAGSDAKIIVEGSLEAVGTEADSIIFSMVDGQQIAGKWDGIHLILEIDDKISATSDSGAFHQFDVASNPQQEGTATLKYCRIEYAKNGITAQNDKITIENCLIQNNSENGVLWEDSYPNTYISGLLKNCKISNNSGFGVTCKSNSVWKRRETSPIISQNIIENNGNGGINLHAHGCSVSSTGVILRRSSGYVAPIIEKNIIRNNNGAGIEAYSAGYESHIMGNIHHYAHAYIQPIIKNNIVYGNNAGLKTACHLSDYFDHRLSHSFIALDHNTLWNNGEDILSSSDSATVVVSNSILWNENGGRFRSDNSEIFINYSDLSVGFSGTGNINSAPQFVDAENGNFNLSIQSPCIDAGCPDSTKDADNTITDMGAIYYHQSIAAFSLISPCQDTTVSDFLPTLKWEEAATGGGEPIYYDVYFSQDLTKLESNLLVSDLSDNFYQLSDSLEEFVTYYWKVHAKNPWTLTRWSDSAGTFSVNTDTLPPSFSEQWPTISLNEDDSLSIPLNWWYQYVSDNRCPDSSLVFQLSSGKFVSAKIYNSTCYFKSDSLNWFGQDTLKLTVTDKSRLSASKSVLVNVNPINDPPTISGLPDSLVFCSDSSVILNLWDFCEDVETPDSLLEFDFRSEYSFPVDDDSLQWIFNDKTGILLLRPSSPHFSGDVDFLLTVSDDSSATASGRIKVRVYGTSGINTAESAIPKSFKLYQNVPNPFNPETKIKYQLAKSSQVSLIIFDLIGREVRTLVDGQKQAGYHQIIWDGKNNSGETVASGIYICRMATKNYVSQIRLVLIH